MHQKAMIVENISLRSVLVAVQNRCKTAHLSFLQMSKALVARPLSIYSRLKTNKCKHVFSNMIDANGRVRKILSMWIEPLEITGDICDHLADYLRTSFPERYRKVFVSVPPLCF